MNTNDTLGMCRDANVCRCVDMTSKFLIGNLPTECDREKVVNWLSRFGKVRSWDIPVNERNGKLLGYAYVVFETRGAALQVAKNIDGDQFEGRTVTCEPAVEQAPAKSIFRFFGLR